MSAVGVLTSPRREALHLFLIIAFLFLLFFFLDGLWFFEGLLEDGSLDRFTIVYYPILFFAPPAIAAYYGRRIQPSWLAFLAASCPFLVLGLSIVVSCLFSLQPSSVDVTYNGNLRIFLKELFRGEFIDQSVALCYPVFSLVFFVSLIAIVFRRIHYLGLAFLLLLILLIVGFCLREELLQPLVMPRIEPDLVGFTLTSLGIALGLIGLGGTLLQRHRWLGIFVTVSGIAIWFGAILLFRLDSIHGGLFDIYMVRVGIFGELL